MFSQLEDFQSKYEVGFNSSVRAGSTKNKDSNVGEEKKKQTSPKIYYYRASVILFSLFTSQRIDINPL